MAATITKTCTVVGRADIINAPVGAKRSVAAILQEVAVGFQNPQGTWVHNPILTSSLSVPGPLAE
jgi:hypothetical protein